MNFPEKAEETEKKKKRNAEIETRTEFPSIFATEMKVRLGKTKVVIRHLPPSLTRSDLVQQIDNHFAGRYNWFSFRPGKNSYKHQRYSRAYINFNCPEDVYEFAELFDGHIFVNEKGAQHKATVEYAPFQRVLKPSTKKDGREGTVYKDPDYLEFLKVIAKPADHLPSAEIQLERKESEQAGAAKDSPIVTPLMEYVRQKRAVESGTQASSVVAKVSRRARAALQNKPGSNNNKRASEKKKDHAKSANRKDKSDFTVVPSRGGQLAASGMKGPSDTETGPIAGIPLTADSGKKKILLLKGKEREIPNITEGMVRQKNLQSTGNSPLSTALKQNQRREASGRLIRTILLKNEARQSQPTTASQQKIQILSSENGKRPPKPSSARAGLNGLDSNDDSSQLNSEGDSKMASDEKYVKRDLHVLGRVGERIEKHTRNKDRPDRGVWTPLRRSNVSLSVTENLSSSATQPTLSRSESFDGEIKDVPSGRKGGEFSASAGGRNSSSVENGSKGHLTHRGAANMGKDDDAGNLSEGKPSKRGGTGHGSHEKQVWVQKSSSGS